MEAPKFIQNIDWELLKKQKQDLLYTMSIVNSKLEDSFEGILHLIDSLQDYAVEEMGIEENTVFNLNDDGDKIIGYQVLDENNDIHPDMETSYSIYSYNRAMSMLGSDTESRYRLVTIYEGEIENPIFI